MMMIMHSTLILGKTCLTESARLLRWLGIDQTFHCYSLFSNHSAVTQDTLLLLCFLHVFPFLFCVLLPRIFLCFLFICASFWIFSGLDRFFTPDIVLLLVGRSGYFKLFSVQRTTAEKIWKSGSRICSAFAFFDPWNKKPNNYRKNYVHIHYHFWHFPCSNQNEYRYLLSFVIIPTINIRVKMDGLNLAKELRVFNKSYPTKAPPAEGEAAVRKIRLMLFLLCVFSKITHSRNKLDPPNPFLTNDGFMGNIDQQEMIETNKSEKKSAHFIHIQAVHVFHTGRCPQCNWWPANTIARDQRLHWDDSQGSWWQHW